MPRLSKIGAAALAAFGWTGLQSVTVTYLVVAGGGGGGGGLGGGGGGGGLLASTASLNPTLSYTVTVGAGGTGATLGVSATGTSGSNSVFGSFTATGGGGGGTSLSGGSTANNGLSGGSGGGGSGRASGSPAGTGGTATSGQGFAGGNGITAAPLGGGGGGGASAVGATGKNTGTGAGGAGVASSISGTSVTYAGGGGGGSDTTAASGGAGGGGNSGAAPAGAGVAGTANLGGGGGGGSGGGPNGGNGAQGGSGIVIISYPGAQQFGGGVVTTDGTNTIHTFTTSGTLLPLSTPLTANFLVVAGGGAGAGGVGGGGGAGGFRTSAGTSGGGGSAETALTLYTNSIYTVTVGAGGTAGGTESTPGTNGGNSSISSIISTGGGCGGSAAAGTTGQTGGSGGGQGGNISSAGSGTANQGYGGGTTSTGGTNTYTGGGGGAGAVGGSYTAGTSSGAGGAGVSSSISGSAVTYGGGGGGGRYGAAVSGGAGGAGGGGAGCGGSSTTRADGSAGTANTGGAGGGGSGNGGLGGAGGSGVVIISYPGSTQQMAGGTVTISGGNVIHTFTSSGYLTPITYASRSLRFRSSATASLSRTFATTGTSRQIFTLSFWVKRGVLGSVQQIMGCYDGSVSFATGLYFTASDTLNFDYGGAAQYQILTTQVFRDPSSWYHIVVACDSTQATAANRVKIYVNGSQVTSFSTANYPAQNANGQWMINTANNKIGTQWNSGSNWLDGYLTEINFVDGAALTPSSFGTFNSFGVWQPITYGGSYGTNGFYLTFGDNTSTTTLGYDTSPQGNNWTTNNFVATNATTIWSNYLLTGGQVATGAASVFNGSGTGGADAPNGVDAVFTPPSSISYNSLEIKWGNSNNNNSSGCPLFINGVQVAAVNGGQGGGKTQIYTTSTPGTFTSISIGGGISGQYQSHIDYIKVNGLYLTDYTTPNNDSMTDVPTLTSATVANYATLNPIQTGSYATLSNASLRITGNTATNSAGSLATIGSSTGKWYYEAVVSNTGAAWVGVVTYWAGNPAYLIDENNVYGANSATNKGIGIRGSGTTYGNAAEKQSISAFTFAVGAIVGVAIDADNGAVYFSVNGTYLNSGVPTSGASKTGSFTNWTPDSTRICFPALCAYNSSNYAEGNFGQRPFTYTAPSGFVALNTYNLSTPTIPTGADYMNVALQTGTGAAADIPMPNGMAPDFIWLKSRSTGSTNNVTTNRLVSNGNTLFTNTTGAEIVNPELYFSGNNAGMQPFSSDAGQSGQTYVLWGWKAGGGTGVSNTSGTITSTVSANTTAGFSVVTYTGSGANATVGHGLGVVPSMMIFKNRTSVYNWAVYHASIPNASTTTLELNNTDAATGGNATTFNSTAPTSSVFSLGTNDRVNRGTNTFVAYVFAAIAGYSAMGSYTGNGSTDGPFVYTGFRPRFILIKCSSNSTGSTVWTIFDTRRSPYNASVNQLYANLSAAEDVDSDGIDILSNGFKPKRNSEYANLNGWTYIYAAFAENPFKYANAR